ncbi:MAG TPA: hypothetical protein VHJ38_06095 [Nitrososphaeraceae archaeon]|jgi:hypothetical protein|nr:hypothetical protein [Nitrososphaeraceae archaeon]
MAVSDGQSDPNLVRVKLTRAREIKGFSLIRVFISEIGEKCFIRNIIIIC